MLSGAFDLVVLVAKQLAELQFAQISIPWTGPELPDAEGFDVSVDVVDLQPFSGVALDALAAEKRYRLCSTSVVAG